MMNNLIVVNNNDTMVSGRMLHEFLEVESNYTTWMNRLIENYDFIEKVDFIPILEESNGGRPSTNHILKINCAKEISMVSNTEKGRQARKYFIACEEKLKQIQPQYKLPQTYLEALKELVVLEEHNGMLQLERDDAIRTKAYISDKKTATACGRVGGLVRSNNRLREEVGFNKNFATIKKMNIITGKSFNWRLLKEYSKKFELEIASVPDINYDRVNAYSAEAWFAVYEIDLGQLVESDNE